jgi:hypothetical protein
MWTSEKEWNRPGYSLGEMLAAMVIAAAILTTILGIYGRVQQAGSAAIEKVESPALCDEVLQLIAKDLDRAIGADGVTIEVKNGSDNGFSRAQLTLRQVLHDAQGNDQTLYQIVWQAGYDYDSGSDGLIIYRSYEGVIPEDKLFEEKRELWEKNYPFVPVCRGITFFRIEVPTEDRYVDQWSGPALPAGLRVTLSSAEPYQAAKGAWTVPDEQKRVRTIAIDRTRVIRLDTSGMKDANEPNTPKMNEPNVPQNVRR